MFGLVVVFFMGLYLLISLLVIFFSARTARKHGRRGWVWGLVSAFVMYNLVFWDWIPTVAMHKYYCATEAGYWVYKTPEEWAKENPGVLETLVPHTGDAEYEFDGGKVSPRNERFGHFSKWATKTKAGIAITQRVEGTIDLETNKFLYKRIEFSSGPTGTGVYWKSWLQTNRCSEKTVVTTSEMRKFDRQLHMKRKGEW